MLKRDFLEKPYDYMNDILLFLYNNKGRATRNELVDFFNISLPTLNEYLSRAIFERRATSRKPHLNSIR